MNIGSTNAAGTWQVHQASDTLGQAKPLSELFSEIYSPEEREEFAGRYLDAVKISDQSINRNEKQAKEQLEYYLKQYEYHSKLLDAQSGKLNNIEENIKNYQSEVDFFENYSTENDSSRTHLFKMAAAMLGLSTQEVVDGYETRAQ